MPLSCIISQALCREKKTWETLRLGPGKSCPGLGQSSNSSNSCLPGLPWLGVERRSRGALVPMTIETISQKSIPEGSLGGAAPGISTCAFQSMFCNQGSQQEAGSNPGRSPCPPKKKGTRCPSLENCFPQAASSLSLDREHMPGPSSQPQDHCSAWLPKRKAKAGTQG